MPKYRLLMEGRNFYLDVEGTVERYGFFSTVWVEAESASQAEQKAVTILRHQDDLRAMVRNRPENAPRMYADKIEVLAPDECLQQSQGRTLYLDPVGKWWQFWLISVRSTSIPVDGARLSSTPRCAYPGWIIVDTGDIVCEDFLPVNQRN